MKKQYRNILLLTATIKPNINQPGLSIVNDSERLSQYIEALDFYISAKASGQIDAIVFVDNSGFDLSDIKAKYQADDVEIISFYGLDYPSDYHRGFGEMSLIVKAYESSKILGTSREHDRVWKVTGRYKITNINQVLRLSAETYDLLCKIKRGWLSMEIFSWSRNGFSGLIRTLPEHLKSRVPPEVIIPKLLAENKLLVTSQMIYPPYIVGVRGSDGKPFIGRFGFIRHIVAIFGFWPRKILTRMVEQ